MSDTLKKELVKLGATNPALRADLRPVLAALDKRASDSMLWRILDEKDFYRLYRNVEKDDEQSAELLYKIKGALDDALSLSSNETMALNRLTHLLNATSHNPAGARNIIFKIADHLGIKLPSSHF